MKLRWYYMCAALLLAQPGKAQSNTGLTHVPDTSFTNYSAYQSLIKKYPQINLVSEIGSASIVEHRNIVYDDSGNRPLMLDVFAPKASPKKTTAIMFIHGGGWRSGNRAQHYALAQRLALLGYVCITPEYRLSTEALYPAAVKDLKSALQWIHAHTDEFNIDSNHIAVAGFSAGGQLAALIGTTQGDTLFDSQHKNTRVNAIIDIDGILAFIHPESGEGDDSKRISAATNWFGYKKTERPDLWAQASALTYVNANTPPVLFINSSVARMHAGRDDFNKVLDRFGVYHEIHSFENAPHPFCLFEPWFTPTLDYINAFLKKVFRG